MSDWPHTVDELSEFILVVIFCILPAILIVFNLNGIICGVLH